MDLKPLVHFQDFEKLDIRVGKVLTVKEFPEAKKPAYQLTVDFGSIGIKKSSAQLTQLYEPDVLVGKQVLAVCNFPPRQIGPFQSEVLVLGLYTDLGVVLIQPDQVVAEGSILG